MFPRYIFSKFQKYMAFLDRLPVPYPKSTVLSFVQISCYQNLVVLQSSLISKEPSEPAWDPCQPTIKPRLTAPPLRNTAGQTPTAELRNRINTASNPFVLKT